MIIPTRRLTLRSWQDSDLEPFAILHANPTAMQDYGRTFDRSESEEKFIRYRTAYERTSYTRWAVEDHNKNFLGYVGPLLSREDHPLGLHTDIGWRMMPSAWGHGFTTEAAKACLQDLFTRCGLSKAFAYTAKDNIKSRNVMERLQLQREPSLDFDIPDDGKMWHGHVWMAMP